MEQKYIALKETERLQNLPYESYGEYLLDDSNTPWLAEILTELCDYDPEDQEFITQPTTLKANFQIKRDINQRYKDYLLIHAEIEASYYTQCSRCLMPALEHIDFKFQIGFIHEKFENLEELFEQDTCILENDEYELYFYNKHNIPFKECVREQIMMNLIPYPLHHPDCKGLCPQCGQNLNIKDCTHSK
jgi:uncharacterized protein